ncbi:MAG: hypothetical protein NTZ19_02230 [Bacteroidetes bacterium]|nr:hypothetical protein [Bacteroidota bacterium]
MKKIIVITVGTFLFVIYGHSQTTTDSIKATVNQMFLAMKNSDGQMLQSSFSDSAILQTIIKNKSGIATVKNESVADFVGQINKIGKGDADERIQFDLIKIDGDLAIVWTPYQFYYKGNFSHCGVNSFHLVRLANGWKIQYLIDTRRKNACVE